MRRVVTLNAWSKPFPSAAIANEEEARENDGSIRAVFCGLPQHRLTYGACGGTLAALRPSFGPGRVILHALCSRTVGHINRNRPRTSR